MKGKGKHIGGEDLSQAHRSSFLFKAYFFVCFLYSVNNENKMCIPLKYLISPCDLNLVNNQMPYPQPNKCKPF